MIENKKPVCIHFHIFKNAGSTLDEALKKNFSNKHLTMDEQAKKASDIFSWEQVLSFLNNHKDVKSFSSHIIRFPLPESNHFHFLPIVFIRHPIDRIFSIYSFNRRRQDSRDDPGVKMCKTKNISEFIEWGLKNRVYSVLKNFQTRFLSRDNYEEPKINFEDYNLAVKRLKNCTVIGVVDRLDESLVLCEETLKQYFPGINLADRDLNVSPERIGLLHERLDTNNNKKQIGENLFSKLMNENEYDFKLYKVANDELDKRISEIKNFEELLKNFRKRKKDSIFGKKYLQFLNKFLSSSGKGGKALGSIGNTYRFYKIHGLGSLLGLIVNKIKNDVISFNFNSKKTPKIYQKSNWNQKNIISNFINVEGNFPIDKSLRQFTKFESDNITGLTINPKVSIIIITYNQVDFLKKNLYSIESKTTYNNYEIIIVTNNLDENSEMSKFLRTVNHSVYVFQNEYSFGAMNNFGASKAKGEFIVFLNDDIEIMTPYWIEAFLSLGLNDEIGAVGGKLVSANGKLQDCGGIVWKNGHAMNYGRNFDIKDPKINYVRDVDYCSGSCLFVKKNIFEKLKGFDRTFDPAYWEDTDLCFSIRKLGYRVLYQPLAVFTHYEGMTQGTDTSKGLKSFQIVNQKKFEKKWKLELNNHLVDSRENMFIERNTRTGLNVLFIGDVVPEPDKDSGALRTYSILCILSHMKNKVTFWPDSLRYSHPYVKELQQKGIEVICGLQNFNNFLKKRKKLYDVVILSRPYISRNYIDAIKKYIPNVKIIYDTVDLHFLRMSRQKTFENKISVQEINQMHELEWYLIKKSDITILTSYTEGHLLHQEDSSIKLAILPNIHSENENIENFEERKDMVFVGGFQHKPNIDAVKYLICEIWPIIKRNLPEVKLYIVGSNPTEDIKKYSSEDIVVTGFVEDITPYFRKCKVMLAPLRYGSGVKGKITQSLSMGLPVVTTNIGAEGINFTDNQNVMMAETPEKFAEKAMKVYQDSILWNSLSKNSLNLAKEYSPEKARACLTTIISSVLNKE